MTNLLWWDSHQSHFQVRISGQIERVLAIIIENMADERHRRERHSRRSRMRMTAATSFSMSKSSQRKRLGRMENNSRAVLLMISPRDMPIIISATLLTKPQR